MSVGLLVDYDRDVVLGGIAGGGFKYTVENRARNTQCTSQRLEPKWLRMNHLGLLIAVRKKGKILRKRLHYITLHYIHTLHTLHTYIHYIHYIHTYITFIHTYIHYIHTYIHAYIHTYIHTGCVDCRKGFPSNRSSERLQKTKAWLEPKCM